jgi:uncharacterized protein YwgA
MRESNQALEPHELAARLVDDAGGTLVGRTRLQKVACLAKLAGLLPEFNFEYRHYGPFSEQLADSMEIATGLKLVAEREERAAWGGWYSVYTRTPQTPVDHDAQRKQFISRAAEIGAIALELAATAAYLSAVEMLAPADAWEETARRKPEKAAEGRLELAKGAYATLMRLPTPRPLPAIV